LNEFVSVTELVIGVGRRSIQALKFCSYVCFEIWWYIHNFT